MIYNICNSRNIVGKEEKISINMSLKSKVAELSNWLDDIISGNDNEAPINLGITPYSIQLGGAGKKDLLLYKKTINKKLKKHPLEKADIIEAFLMMHSPIMVMKGNDYDHDYKSVLAICEMKGKDGIPYIASVELHHKLRGEKVTVNKLTSIYPKDKDLFHFMENNLDNIIAVDINKAEQFLSVLGLQLPYDKKLLGFDDNLPYIKEIVNVYDLLQMDNDTLQRVFDLTQDITNSVRKENVLMDMKNSLQGKVVFVAIESTSDYQNPDEGFTYYVSGEIPSTKYRLVRIGEDGNLVPYPDEKLIFKEQQDIKDYIATNSSTLEEMNYDDMVYLAAARKAEVLEQKKEQIKNSMHNFEFEDGYLYFSIDVNGYSYDGLYRIYDPANGRSRELVSIDNGISEPFFKENWDLMSEYLHRYVKEHPQIGPEGNVVNREKPSIYCEWSEHSAFEEGKVYSITEFNQLMKTADEEWAEKHKEWEQRIQDEFGGEIPEMEVRDRMTPEELVGLMPYQKNKFTVYLPEYAPITERQDIGDGDGGVIDFFRKMGREKIAQELEIAIANELEEGRVDPKMVLEHHQETAELEHILQMVNDFSKLYGEANTPFSRDGFQHRLSDILTEYKKVIDSNPNGVVTLLPTFLEEPNPNEIDIRGNRLWNEFWQALERYGITGDEKNSADINSIATDSNTQEKALSIMKEIQHYLDDRLYVQSYMKDGEVINVDYVSHYSSMVPEEVIDDVFLQDTVANAQTDNKQYEGFVTAHQDYIANKEVSRIPVVINAFGGPGSGKSVSCMDICQQLKKLGYNAEYVQEYAKDLVYDENWDMLDGSSENQFEILKEQLRRVERLYGTVDFIVTDSPVLLNSVYNKSLTPQYDNMVTSLYKNFENFTYFVERDTSSYQQEGRIQNLEESQKIDEEIKQLLAEKEVYYGTYNHDTINKIVSNSIKTFNRINHIAEEATAKQIAYAEKIATTLNIDLPEESTKESYRFFISENQEKFVEANNQASEDSAKAMTYEDYLEKVSQNGNLLKDIPEEHYTEDLLLAAVSNWGAAIRNVPADKLTSAIVLASVTQYGTNLRHVPKEMRSEEACIAAYVSSAGKAIRYTPNEIKDAVKEKAQEILANNNNSISSSKRQIEVEQLQEQGQEWATQISNMLREHEADPEAMIEDIMFASKFYQYSVKNIQIMRHQNPGITFVASASAFEHMGYHVKNDEKAMIARVPSFSKYIIDEDGKYIYASKYTPEIKNKIKQGVLEEHEKLTRYVFRPAFYDISQTDCPVEDYPSMFHMGVPSELHQEAFHAMKEFAEDSLGFKVMTVDLKSISLRGNCEPDNRIIRINDKLAPTLALSTLCHEIAHGIIHTSRESVKMTTAQKECEADVMAIMLESSMGLAISESRREHFYQAFQTYKEEQAAKEHPYEVTLEKLIDRVQKKVFRPYAEDIKYYLDSHLPVDGVQNDKVARNLVKDMALFDSAYQLHFNLSIEPEHELFAEEKIELYRTLYQQTKEEYRLGNSFVPKLAVIKDFGKDETFLTSVQFIDKETVDTIKNLSAHVTQEYLPLQIELGDVLAIKENVLEDSQLYLVTEQGLQPLSDKLNQELENKINCGFDVSTEYQCIRNLLQNNIEILSDTIPEYYNHICERFGYIKDVVQTTSNQFMARINLITEGMSSNDKELIAEYVFRTGNYQKAEKYAEKLQKEPGISKQLLQEMRLIDSYKYMLWTIADYEDTHSVSSEKRITTGAYNTASIPVLSENAHSLSQINECFLEIKRHNAPESIKYYSIVTEEEGYRIGYVELDDYVPTIKYSVGVYSSYEEAKEFYNLYLETSNSHLVAAVQANYLVDLEKEANVIALSDVTAIGNTIADEKYRYKEAGIEEDDLLNLLRDKIKNGYPDVNETHTLDVSVQVLKDFKKTINEFGEKHFVELCNLDDFSDINTMEESLRVANWLSKQREVIANSDQNGIEAVTQLINIAMENCVTTADLEQAYNAIDSIVLNSEYSNLKAHFDGFEDYNNAFDTLKSSFVTADRFCYIDYKAEDIPKLYTSDLAGNMYEKSLRNEWTGSVQEMHDKLQKAGYEVCMNFDDFKAYTMNNHLAGPGAPERKKEGVYVRVIESTSDLLTKGQTLSVYDFKNYMDKIYSGSSDIENSVTYKLITRNNHEIKSYIDTYSGDANMNVYEKLYNKAKEQAPELCKLIGKQYYQDVVDFSERHLMKPLLEQLKEQGKTEVDSEELQNLTSSCDELREVIKKLDLSPAEAEILKLNVGNMQVNQVADIQRQMEFQQNQQLQQQRNKQNEEISFV